MPRVKQNCLGLTLLLASAAAFGGLPSIRYSRTTTPLRRTLRNKSRPHKHHPQLHAVEPPSSSPAEPPLLLENDNKNTEAPLSKYDDGDPRQALEQFGSLFAQVQAIFVEGSSWDNDKLEAKTQEFVRTYIRVFVPGMGYAATSLAVFVSSFVFFMLALSISGRGYNDILAAVDGIGPLKDLLEKADPAWGNAAIALLGCELLGPVILAVTLALTPKTMDVLRSKLEEWGWGEDDIDERAAEILRGTT
eukprot:CAMPEP_0195524156 /NCGR_PEP_ID=MMETSP0794_2-20130614/23836_1 /TAXON_ID=515487 /ORGANISM="Stephanopyxis turris, Strain CCMP 815" /LENGTH=247 /DNA_ID=CAMNT_0040654323 /DNA_START=93 /DNA_END=836 /DNA_ORIENTATION=+